MGAENWNLLGDRAPSAAQVKPGVQPVQTEIKPEVQEQGAEGPAGEHEGRWYNFWMMDFLQSK